MFNAFGSVIQNKIAASPLLRGALSSLQIEAANEVLIDMFGPNIAEGAQAMYIKENAVTVACMHAPIAQELKLREKEFVERLKKKRYAESGIDRVGYLLDEAL